MNLKIKAEPRTTERKSDVKKVRNSGLIPGIIYGEGKEGIMIALPKIEFAKVFKKSIGQVAIYDIELEGQNYKTFLKDQQIHPVSREVMHVDFVELHKGNPITIEVPIHYNGTAEGTKLGGALEILHYTIEITCLPKDIPEDINVDVTNLKLGQGIHLGDIELGEGMQSSLPAATTLVSVRAPRGVDADEGDDADAEAETAEATEEA